MYYEAQKHFKGFGVNVEGVSYDWGQIQKQKDDAVSGLTKGIEGLFKKYKVGVGRLWGGPGSVRCEAVERVGLLFLVCWQQLHAVLLSGMSCIAHKH